MPFICKLQDGRNHRGNGELLSTLVLSERVSERAGINRVQMPTAAAAAAAGSMVTTAAAAAANT